MDWKEKRELKKNFAQSAHYCFGHPIKKKIIDLDFAFLKNRSWSEQEKLLSHITDLYVGEMYEEKAIALYKQKKRLLCERKDIVESINDYFQSFAQDEEDLETIAYMLTLVEENPKLAPLVNKRILSNLYTQKLVQDEDLKKKVKKRLTVDKDFSDEQIRSIIELYEQDFLNNTSLVDIVFYSPKKLEHLKSYLSNFSEQSILYRTKFTAFYCDFMKMASPVGLDEEKEISLFSLLEKCDIYTCQFLDETYFEKEENELLTKTINGIMILYDFVNLGDFDFEMVQDVVSGRNNQTAVKNIWKILLSPSFQEGNERIRKALVTDFYENMQLYRNEKIFASRRPFLTMQGQEKSLDTDTKLAYLSYVTTSDKDLLDARLNLLSLKGFESDSLHMELIKRMQNVKDVERAMFFVESVKVNLLGKEDEALRKNTFALLPGDEKEIELDDIILKIPDYTYIKRGLDANQPKTIGVTLQKKRGQ